MFFFYPSTALEITIDFDTVRKILALSCRDHKREDIMKRKRALKIVLVVLGLLFCLAVYPLILMAKQDPALAMMMSLYVTLGVFLLLASRNPSAHRSLIAFAAWSSFAHAGVMSCQAFLNMISRRELIGSAVFAAIGAALIVLAPAKSVEQISASVA
jgi:glucan phosphoethanolaminetransferase (alkaline phosphatase superfamily)